ncbi:MAG: hypothetical protein HXX18_06980 [Bacteroidetes bacterium]|nr:hypothetical protein [Bacteroidota bacterium]
MKRFIGLILVVILFYGCHNKNGISNKNVVNTKKITYISLPFSCKLLKNFDKSKFYLHYVNRIITKKENEIVFSEWDNDQKEHKWEYTIKDDATKISYEIDNLTDTGYWYFIKNRKIIVKNDTINIRKYRVCNINHKYICTRFICNRYGVVFTEGTYRQIILSDVGNINDNIKLWIINESILKELNTPCSFYGKPQ